MLHTDAPFKGLLHLQTSVSFSEPFFKHPSGKHYAYLINVSDFSNLNIETHGYVFYLAIII